MGSKKPVNEDFFKTLLERQELTPDQLNYAQSIEEKIRQVLKNNLKGNFELYIGGSIVKNTALRDKFDICVIINFPNEIEGDVKNIHQNVGNLLQKKWKKGQLKNLGWETALKKNLKVIIIPGIFNENSNMGSYFDATTDKIIDTNFKAQNEHVLNSDRQDVIRLMKFWALRRAVPINSFFLEHLVMLACRGISRELIEKQLTQTFNFIHNSIDSKNFNDPVNPNNNISRNLTQENKIRIKLLAKQVLEAKTWNKVFKK